MNQLTIAILGTFHLHTCSARSLHYQAEEEVIKVHDGAAAWEVDGGLVQLTNDTSPPMPPGQLHPLIMFHPGYRVLIALNMHPSTFLPHD